MLSEQQKIDTYKTLGLIAMDSGGGQLKVDWAMRLLEQGIETQSLAILATLQKFINEFEADEYFSKVLSELNIIHPNKTDAIQGYVKVVASEVIEGITPPDVGASMIYRANVNLDYPEYLGDFVSLDDEWYCEHINGWSVEQRASEIIKVCREVYGSISYPNL